MRWRRSTIPADVDAVDAALAPPPSADEPRVRPPRRRTTSRPSSLMGEAFDTALTGTGDWSEEDVAARLARARPTRSATPGWSSEDGAARRATRRFQDDADGCFQADGYVHPERFGHGIGALIVELTERRAAEQLEIVTLPRVVMQNTVLHVDRAARDLLEAAGLPPQSRHFLRMQIDMAEPPPGPEWPDGVVGGAVSTRTRISPRCTPASRRRSPMSGRSRPESLEAWRRRKLEDPRFDASALGGRARGRRGVRRRALHRRPVRHGVRERARRATRVAAARARLALLHAGVHVVLGARRAPRRARRRHREPRMRCASTSGPVCAPSGRRTSTRRCCAESRVRGPTPAAGDRPACEMSARGTARRPSPRAGDVPSPFRSGRGLRDGGTNSSRRRA